MSRGLFVTGGTGFAGRRFLHRLPHGLYERVFVLTRSPERVAAADPPVTPIPGDLAGAPSWDEELAASDTVVHLAARAGRAPADEIFRVNVEGTERLLEACRRVGVARFVYVSSVAAKYRDISRYPYAGSKRAAEAAVRESGLTYCIVRPTLIAGRGGASWERLQALARLPLVPLPGTGAALTQPVYVEDFARCLVSVLREDRFWNDVHDIGGPERVRVEALVRAIHRHHRGGEGRVVHLSRGPLLSVLGRLGAPLPFFLEDGVAEPNPLLDLHRPTMRDVAAMIALSAGPRDAPATAATGRR